MLVGILSAAALFVGAGVAALTGTQRSHEPIAQGGQMASPAGSLPASPSASGPHGAGSPAPGQASLPPIPDGALPILYYHRVEAVPADYPTWSKMQQAAFIDYDVTTAAFAAQLDWLKANGYTTILPRDLAAHWDSGQVLPPKPVILTFDDGWHDWVSTVLPMLQARGMVAEFYLTLTAIGDGNITWPEVQTLSSAGEGIGAHDVHHVQLAELGGGKPDASPAAMWSEVNGARQIIGSHIGIYPDSMAYVGGGFSPALEALVRQAGYTTARSIRRGIVQTPALRYELHVVRIGPYDDVTNRLTWTIDPNLPTFVARMHGVSDQTPGE
ncbi:MAG TPA: polysaccharide deacetylase family protein [Candidatus Limnocylindrales bacterium]|nr:polysaccharide deacetylase family protein [Candidatus Limnocylindrales bacterium]